MSKPSLTIISIIFSVTYAFAQAPDTSWLRFYGGDYLKQCWGSAQTSDGGYVLVGSTLGGFENSYDVYLVRIDEAGNEIWAKNYGGNGSDRGYAVKQTSDQGFILCGYINSVGYLIKTDENGDTLWTRSYYVGGIRQLRSLDLCYDGGYILAGWTFDSFGEDLYLLKTDSLGNELWSETFGGNNAERAWSVIQCSDSGYAVAGWTESTSGRAADIYVIKTDANGDSLWSATVGGSRNQEGRSIVETSDGGFAVAGKSESFTGIEFYLVKLAANGFIDWEQAYHEELNIIGHSLIKSYDSGFIMAGYDYYHDIAYILETDSLGNEIWTQEINPDDNIFCHSIINTQDESFAVAGYINNRAFLAKYEPEQTPVINNPEIPRRIYLSQNYPNPFNTSTVISYEIPTPGHIVFDIYNITGQKVATLFDGYRSTGNFYIVWDAAEYPSGVYFAQLEAGAEARSMKMILLK